MKGTGRWTVQEAAERSTAAPTMAAALDARYMSGRKAEREEAAKILTGPTTFPKVPKEQLVEDMKAALYCSKICSYAQVRLYLLSVWGKYSSTAAWGAVHPTTDEKKNGPLLSIDPHLHHLLLLCCVRALLLASHKILGRE